MLSLFISDGRGGDSIASDLCWLIQHEDFLSIGRCSLPGGGCEYHVTCTSERGRDYGYRAESWDEFSAILPAFVEGIRQRDAGNDCSVIP